MNANDKSTDARVIEIHADWQGTTSRFLVLLGSREISRQDTNVIYVTDFTRTIPRGKLVIFERAFSHHSSTKVHYATQ